MCNQTLLLKVNQLFIDSFNETITFYTFLLRFTLTLVRVAGARLSLSLHLCISDLFMKICKNGCSACYKSLICDIFPHFSTSQKIAATADRHYLNLTRSFVRLLRHHKPFFFMYLLTLWSPATSTAVCVIAGI